jgi:hypothetical protein
MSDDAILQEIEQDLHRSPRARVVYLEGIGHPEVGSLWTRVIRLRAPAADRFAVPVRCRRDRR